MNFRFEDFHLNRKKIIRFFKIIDLIGNSRRKPHNLKILRNENRSYFEAINNDSKE